MTPEPVLLGIQMLLFLHFLPHASVLPLPPDCILWLHHSLLPDIFLFRQPCKRLAGMMNEPDFLGDMSVQKHSLEHAQCSSFRAQCKCRNVLWGWTEVTAAETEPRLRLAF